MRAFMVGCSLALLMAGSADAKTFSIKVLSSPRADLVTDGQALVQVSRRATVTLNGADVTDAFKRRGGRMIGLVDGLALGANEIVATAGDRAARLTLTNHPNGGPVFTGKQIQPWRCQSGAVDAQCNQPAQYTYLYRSTDPTAPALQPYDPQSPPDDVATVKTEKGATVPFIVRQELGYLDRDQYKILVLFDPARPWSRWKPQPTFNHKLLVTGGGGCGGSYGTGGAPLEDFSGTFGDVPAIVDSYVNALGRGFAVMSTALANTGHNCNVAVEAEALIMTKERVIERYGDLRHTIGTGCSGGSIVQHTVANAYPGAVYDGLIVTCAYPDTMTAGAQFADYHLLRKYFEDPSRWGEGVVWSPHQWGLVEGHASHVNAVVADEGLFKDAMDVMGGCVAAELMYDPAKNPGGVRCDILDYMVTLFGRRPESVWTSMEKAAGHGFAGVPFANGGLQYGLEALQAGQITAEQFVDLNEKVGGLDMNMQPTPVRIAGDDESVANTYRTGMLNEGDNLDRVAIIDHAGADPGAAHDYSHTWWTRDRLDKANGHHENQVLWYGPAALVGDVRWPTEALLAMDRWLTAVRKDDSKRSLPRKIVVNRPKDVHDRCTYGVRVEAADGACVREAETRFGTPREVAGGPRENDVLECALKPLDRSEYGLLGLSDAQFDRLKAVFPEGVCNWSVLGVGQQAVVPWQQYGDADTVIYGGEPMGAAPRSKIRRG
jgi:hypothetical protein